MRLTKSFNDILKLTWIFIILISFCVSMIKIYLNEFPVAPISRIYHIIYTSDSKIIENLLYEEVPNAFLSNGNSLVQYNGISSMNQIKVKDMNEYFFSLDPRYDPYMKKISQLFWGTSKGEAISIIYVEKKSISLWSLNRLFAKNISRHNVNWRILGFYPRLILISLILYIIYMGFLLFTNKCRIKLLAGHLNWIPFIIIFGFTACAIAILSSYILCRKKKLLYIVFINFISLFLFYYLGELNLTLLSLWSIALLGNWVSLRGLLQRGGLESLTNKTMVSSIPSRKWKRLKLKISKPEHELFAPIPIMKRSTFQPILAIQNQTLVFKFNYIIMVAILFICLVLLILSERESERLVEFPQWIENGQLNWSMVDLAQLFTEEKEMDEFYISAADYIAHRAFQQSFLYETKWQYPIEENPLIYPIFSLRGDKFTKESLILTLFSEKWYHGQVEMLESDNPAKLLFSTKTPGFVIKKSNTDNYQSFMLLKISFSVLFLLLLFFSDVKKYKDLSFNVKNKLLRRNEQVA